MDIKNLSNEEIEYLRDEYNKIFTRLSRELISRKEYYVNELGGEPIITNLNITLKGKLLIILKKLTKNAIVSGITGVSPMLLDNDLSELHKDTYQYCMKCNIYELAIRVLNDAISGLDELIHRLNSGTQLIETLESIDRLYQDKKDVDYIDAAVRDYTARLVLLLGVYSNIYDVEKKRIFYALSQRGYDVGMHYDFLKDIKEVYSKIDAKTNTLGR